MRKLSGCLHTSRVISNSAKLRFATVDSDVFGYINRKSKVDRRECMAVRKGGFFVLEINCELTKFKLKLIKSNKNLVLFAYMSFFY